MVNKMQDNDDGARVFADARNVSAGRGRILWGTATQTSRNLIVEEGWVLPGGRRTRDLEVAKEYARWIDHQCRARER